MLVCNPCRQTARSPRRPAARPHACTPGLAGTRSPCTCKHDYPFNSPLDAGTARLQPQPRPQAPSPTAQQPRVGRAMMSAAQSWCHSVRVRVPRHALAYSAEACAAPAASDPLRSMILRSPPRAPRTPRGPLGRQSRITPRTQRISMQHTDLSAAAGRYRGDSWSAVPALHDCTWVPPFANLTGLLDQTTDQRTQS